MKAPVVYASNEKSDKKEVSDVAKETNVCLDGKKVECNGFCDECIKI